MEDTIEVCSRCGKMPRAIDLANGLFRCTRCGNDQLMAVTGDDYERVVTELDRRFQEGVTKKRLEEVEKTMPIQAPKQKSDPKKTAKKRASKKTVKKKPAKKKTARKTAKKKKK